MDPIIWYDCPKCGKPKSSDGKHYCGACEEQYQKKMEKEGAFMTEKEYFQYLHDLNE